MWRSLVSRLVRVQEASGSNPDTPTRNLESAFAGSRFFIDGGIRRAAPIRRRRKQVSGKHLLSEKVSAAWLLPSSAHFSSAVPKCQFYSLYCNTRNSLLRLTEFLVLILILSKLTGCLFCRGKKRDQICYKHPPGNIVVSNHLEIAAESFDT